MLNFVIQALEGIFTIIFIVGIGYVLSKKGWFDERSSSLIARLVTTVSLPLYMVTSLTKNFTAERLAKMAPDMLLPVGSMLLALLIGKLAARLFKVQKGRRGIFCTNYFIANTDVYRLAGKSGFVWRPEYSFGNALLYREHNFFLDVGSA